MMAPVERIKIKDLTVVESEPLISTEDTLLNVDFETYHGDSGDEDDSSGQGKPLPSVPRKQWSIKHVIKIVGGAVVLIFLLLCTVFVRHKKAARTSHAIRPSQSRDFALDFPQIYPPLDPKHATSKCFTAWKTLTSIPCHSEISTRNWDGGIPQIMGPSLDRFVPLICREGCAEALLQAQSLLESTCSTSSFLIPGYKGKFNTTLLEPTPSKVLNILVQRHGKMCRTSPTGDAERGFCMTDMQSRWNIVDGIYADGVNGLGWFLQATKTRKTEPAGRHRGMQGSGGWSEKYDYMREERQFGPGKGETTCSWCTLTWMEEKLGLWHEGMIGVEGEELSLPQFLKMWEHAGRRCAGVRFSVAYQKAIKTFMDRGLLTQDWESQPSGDMWYLLKNGPSPGDYPIPQIGAIISDLAAYRESKGGDESQKDLLKIVDEYSTCLSAFQSAALSMECYPFLSFREITNYTLSSLKTARTLCESSPGLVDLRSAVDKACPLSRRNWSNYNRRLYSTGLTLPPLLNNIFGVRGTIENYMLTCAKPSGRGLRSQTPCAAIFAQWGVAQWVMSNQKHIDTKQLVKVTRKVLAATPWPREGVLEWKPPTDRHMTDEDRAMGAERSNYLQNLREGVCSECLWQRFIYETIWTGEQHKILLAEDVSQDVAMEWLKTVHMLADGCRERGVRRVMDSATKELVETKRVRELDEVWIASCTSKHLTKDEMFHPG